MSDEAALLRAIIDNPDEDTPRLIYADWLEEHGDPDRAAFIRLQIRKVQLDAGVPDRDDVSRQELRLFEANRDRWLADLPAWLRRGVPRYSFQRGFLRTLEITGAKTARVPRRVWAGHPIQELKLRQVGGRLERLSTIPHLARVRHLWLDFEGAPTTAADLTALASCPHLGGVRELHVFRAGNPVAEALACCPSLRGLTTLDLYADIDDDGMATLTTTGADNLRGVKRLLVRNARFGPGTAAALARSPALAALEDLAIGFNNNREGQIGDAGATALANSPHLEGLRALTLDGQGIGPEGARALAAAPHRTGLRILSLAGNPLGSEGAAVLASGRWAGLAALDLSRCDLGDAGAAALARSDRLTSLVALELKRNRIGADGAAALSRAAGLDGLVILDLSTNPLGDAGARTLCESTTLANLRRLYAKPISGEYAPEVAAAAQAAVHRSRVRPRVSHILLRDRSGRRGAGDGRAPRLTRTEIGFLVPPASFPRSSADQPTKTCARLRLDPLVPPRRPLPPAHHLA